MHDRGESAAFQRCVMHWFFRLFRVGEIGEGAGGECHQGKFGVVRAHDFPGECVVRPGAHLVAVARHGARALISGGRVLPCRNRCEPRPRPGLCAGCLSAARAKSKCGLMDDRSIDRGSGLQTRPGTTYGYAVLGLFCVAVILIIYMLGSCWRWH